MSQQPRSAIHADTFSTGVSSQTLLPIGVHKLDSSEAVLSNRVTAIASTRRRIAGRHHDAPAKHRLRPRDARGLHSEQNGDELTVWRTLNVTRPDGSQGKIDCGNHHAIVYSRK